MGAGAGAGAEAGGGRAAGALAAAAVAAAGESVAVAPAAVAVAGGGVVAVAAAAVARFAEGAEVPLAGCTAALGVVAGGERVESALGDVAGGDEAGAPGCVADVAELEVGAGAGEGVEAAVVGVLVCWLAWELEGPLVGCWAAFACCCREGGGAGREWQCGG